MSLTIEHGETYARTRSATETTSLFHNPAKAIRLAWNRLRAARQHRHAVTALLRLDNHTLKDIGIDRSEIRSLLTDTNAERRRIMRASGCHGRQGESR